ncbi:MAG TPA: thiamine diphosphokinase [Rhizobiales bacterium]|nr:thiamine diphosphokinase [Hyphomicrobiales bacterium]
MTRFNILLGGNISLTPRLAAQTAKARTIAADSGIRHARALGLEPELWVGDFDSTESQLLEEYRHVRRETHQRNKDETDGAIAIARALEKGAGELVLVGAHGGRSDHVLSHFIQMTALKQMGIACFSSSGDEEAHPLVAGNLRLCLPAGLTLSIIALDRITGLSISGVKWPLENRAIDPGSTLTQSNVTTGCVSISLKGGRGLAVISAIE